MRLSTLLTVLFLAAGSALAHMEMIDPFPILSPANPAVHWEVKNYDMMAPLLWPGDNLPYPCKGYLYSTPASERTVQKTWPAGSWQSVTLGPNGAPHLGGSCQMSLSYDYGRTWQVILSIMGGCPIDTYKMDFQLPPEAPSGEAVFAWSWFNHQGNREMYQNCAIINVTGGGTGLSPSDFPPPFVANAGVNGCSTIEGVDPVFPNPGKNVRFGGPYKGQAITGQRGIRGDNCVDQYAGETPAGSRGRSLAETTMAPVSSSSSPPSIVASSSSSPSASPSPSSTSAPVITPSAESQTTAPSSSAISLSNSIAAPTSEEITTPTTSTTVMSSTTSLAATSSNIAAPDSSHTVSLAPSADPSSSTTAVTQSTSAIGNQHNAAPSPEETSSATATSSSFASSFIAFVPPTTSTESTTSAESTTLTAFPTPSEEATTFTTTTLSSTSSSSSSSSISTPSSTLPASTSPTVADPATLTTSSSSSTAALAPTSSPGNATCWRGSKRSQIDFNLSHSRKRLVRRAVKG